MASMTQPQATGTGLAQLAASATEKKKKAASAAAEISQAQTVLYSLILMFIAGGIMVGISATFQSPSRTGRVSSRKSGTAPVSHCRWRVLRAANSSRLAESNRLANRVRKCLAPESSMASLALLSGARSWIPLVLSGRSGVTVLDTTLKRLFD